MADNNSNILKDVIAEMDQLVSVATANAKISLEEEFTPAIKSMLTRRLRSEAEEASEPEAQLEGVVSNPSDPTLGLGGADFIEGTQVDEEAVDEIVDEDVDIDEETDMSLEAIIRELEDDLADDDDEEEGEEESEEEEGEAEEGEAESEEGEEEPDAEGGEEEEGGEDLPFEAPEGEEGEEGGEEEEASDDAIDALDADAEAPAIDDLEDELHMDGPSLDSPMEDEVAGVGGGLDLEQLMAEIEAEEVASDANFHKMSAEYESLKSELEAYKNAVAVLRGKIQEVNLLNGKLLFTSQLFRKDGLSAEQKINIVEAFDRCVDVREVKLVYTALAESMKIPATKKPAKQKKMVTEGIASAAIGNAPVKKDDAEVITENKNTSRLQFLAGIIPTS